ncbi:MAG: hypothetical protein AAB568_03035 [Patescibacteria group bacterium]
MRYSFRLLLMAMGTIFVIVFAVTSVQRAVTGVDDHYWFVVFYAVVAVYFGFRVHQVWQQLKAEKDAKEGKDE